MKLGKRLSAVAAFVPTGVRLCDVGCDHAHLSIELIKSGRVSSAIAMDVKEGPLSKARQNIREAGLEELVETRLSDGLEKLHPGEAEALVLAGMGGRLVCSILSEGFSVASSVETWVLQPQSEMEEVRRWLRENGCGIVDEDIVVEREKFYPVLKVKPGCDRNLVPDDWMPVFDAFGPMLLSKRHPLLLSYLRQEKKRIGQILPQVGERDDDNVRRLLRRKRLVERALHLYERSADENSGGCARGD